MILRSKEKWRNTVPKGPVSVGGQMKLEPMTKDDEDIDDLRPNKNGKIISKNKKRNSNSSDDEEYLEPLDEEMKAKFEKYEGPILTVVETELRAAEFVETMLSYAFLL
jgi:hypothetical protein